MYLKGFRLRVGVGDHRIYLKLADLFKRTLKAGVLWPAMLCNMVCYSLVKYSMVGESMVY